MRIGTGYDIHRFEAGRRLVVCGVEIESPTGLSGHSDADPVLHAVIDALLGAAALGDIGDHFPPGDDRWQDADSGDLLRQVLTLIQNRYDIANVDVTVVGEYPRIKPYRLQMRQRLAFLLGLPVDRVSIKATTNEGLGALGRSEGLAALASVLIEERGMG